MVTGFSTSDHSSRELRPPKIDSFHKGLIRRLARYSFPFCERLGFHIVPIHFYQPIPDSRTLSPALSERDSQMVGIDLREQAQLDLLERLTAAYKGEYDKLPRHPTADARDFYVYNNSFATVDAEVLYCMIRAFKPRRMIEIGGGMSTLLSALALQRNLTDDSPIAGPPAKFISIEPYPNAVLAAGVPGLSKLYCTEVQNVPLNLFEELGENDILFIDSSHIVRIDGDVNYEFLEILPRLKPGVLVHIHDVYLPREYDVEFFKLHKVFMNEQYLLQAFLTFNSRFEILWAGHFMHVRHTERLKTAFASYREAPGPPFSWWMRSKPAN